MTERNDDISADPTGQDEAFEDSIRPRSFGDFVGQRKVCDNLAVMVQASRMRRSACDHILFAGPPGLGKTTMAHIIARELGVNLHTTSGPVLEKKGDLAGLLSGLEEGDVLFIDEIHRLNAVIEENLYPAMEDFEFDIVIGEGPHARSVKLTLPRFTLVGATTRAGLLTSPLHDRFGYVARMRYYSPAELTTVVLRSAKILGLDMDRPAAEEVARRSRGTPRIANRLLRRIRDYALVGMQTHVDQTFADETLHALEIDKAGFDYMDRKYLHTMIDKFDGGPVGLGTLAASIGEEKDTLQDVYEPFLLQEGYIQRTPRGRIATLKAYAHFDIVPPRSHEPQGHLF